MNGQTERGEARAPGVNADGWMDGAISSGVRASVDFNERNGTSDEGAASAVERRRRAAAIVTSAHEQSGLIVIVTKRGG